MRKAPHVSMTRKITILFFTVVKDKEIDKWKHLQRGATDFVLISANGAKLLLLTPAGGRGRVASLLGQLKFVRNNSSCPALWGGHAKKEKQLCQARDYSLSHWYPPCC